MTPPPNESHPCKGCALQEARDGRVCPVAREVYELPDVAAERHAEALHAAILADAQAVRDEAQAVPAVAELVRRDAGSRTGALPAAIRLGLVAAPSPNPLSPGSRKEVIRVAIPSRTP